MSDMQDEACHQESRTHSVIFGCNPQKMRLLMLTGSDKESTQLKALELLGKMSDVQAFTERLEVNVTHRTTEELQAELATKLSSYMDGIIDVEAKQLQPTEEKYGYKPAPMPKFK